MQTAEKRRKVRRTVRYPATVDVGGDSNPRPCTLCDASQEGAQILVDDAASLPDEFILVLGYDGTARRNCRVVWRSDTQIGVEFTAIPKNAPRANAGSEDVTSDAGAKDPFDIDSLPTR